MLFKVFLINLEKDKGRLEFMSSQLNNLQIFFERFSAINGWEYVGKEYDKELAIKMNNVGLTYGELGCALSHKRCIQKFLASNFEYGLILEDDVLFTSDFKKIAEAEIQKNNEFKIKYKNYNWEYLQFDYWDPKDFWTHRWFQQVKNTFRMQKSLVQAITFMVKTIFKLPAVLFLAILEIARSKIVIGPVKFYRDIYLAGAYLLTREGAKKLLALAEKIVYPADRSQNEAKRQLGLKIKYYSPVVILQQRTKYKSNIGI